MGLLQRFARPEFRTTGDAPDSPPEEERREAAPADERTTSAPPTGADLGGGSVHGSEAFSQEHTREAAVENDAQPPPTEPAPTTSAAYPQAHQPPAEPQVKRAEIIA